MFDGALVPDLSKPSLEGLSYLLRQEMPKGFTWDFSHEFNQTNCGTMGCALGLCYLQWPKYFKRYEDWQFVACDIFSMPIIDVERIFYSSVPYGVAMEDNWGGITPEDVADEIDRYLRSKASVRPEPLLERLPFIARICARHA